jgi:methyltransferase
MSSSWRGFYLAFLTLLALERLGELLLSRRNARRAFARGAIELGQREYRVMAIFHSAFVVACFAQVALWPAAQRSVIGECALAGALVAQALRYWAISTLGERWNVRVIVLPTLPAVVAGPYRWIRHPNYVAVCVEMLCVPLVYSGGAGYGALLALIFTIGNALILRRRIRTEEEALGPDYARAFAATPRFIPGGLS